MKLQIVIAWTVRTSHYDGTPFAADLGSRPRMIDVDEPRACMWLSEGTEADVEKAQAYCDRENARIADDESPRRVFTYPLRERDPLGRAKRAVVASTSA